MNEKTIENAMGIILAAGDARLCCKEALDEIIVADFKKAKEKICESQVKINLAHKIQTDAIQAETRGEGSDYSLLFAHAQDTLMTVYSEINIAKKMISIFEVFDERLKKLENGGK